MQAWLAGLLAKLIESLGGDLATWIEKFIHRWERSEEQKKTAAVVEANQGKPRDQKVDDEDLADINS